MNVRNSRLPWSWGIILLAVFAGRDSLRAAESETAKVQVSRPIAQEVTDHVDFTGRTEAVQSVKVIPRATGYLVREPFREGSDVKRGEVLYEIDSRPYQVQYDAAAAQVNLGRAEFKLAQATLARDGQAARSGSATPQQLDQDRAAVEKSEAQLKAAEAALELCKLNLDFCRVTAPIDGVVGSYYLTPGNLVIQDQTHLTTIVSLDPIYACFDLDESTVTRLRRVVAEAKREASPSSRASKVPVLMGLPNEDGFPHKGVLDFIDNHVNPMTGSALVRGVFSNPVLPAGNRLLLPGMFARVRLTFGRPYQALLVVDRAIGSDQGRKYVCVVDDRGRIEKRHIKVGALQSGGRRVIVKGLTAGDRVVTGGSHCQPGAEVEAEEVPMP